MEPVVGHLAKMKVSIDEPVRYQMRLDEQLIPLNPFLGKQLTLRFQERINCIECGRAIKKSYQNGHCFPCTQVLASCDLCIVKPELCHYHKGTCREPEWAESHCMQDHYVYLANSSGIKVGITRHTQIPTRWIDQGAVAGLPIMRVSSRFQSGIMEMIFKNHVADKTNWRKMLKGEVENIDLESTRDLIFADCEDEIMQFRNRFGEDAMTVLEESVTHLQYPVLEYPVKIKSLNFDKQAEISGTLMGIKGQYLIFDIGVINMRKFAGYLISMSGAS